MNLRLRLIWSATIAIGSAVVLSSVVYVTTGRVSDLVEYRSRITDVVEVAFELHLLTDELLTNVSTQQLENWRRVQAELEDKLSAIPRTDPEDRRFLDEMDEYSSSIGAIFASVSHEASPESVGDGGEIRHPPGFLESNLGLATNELVNVTGSFSDHVRQAISTTHRIARIAGTVLTIVLTIILGTIFVLMGRSLLEPIGMLQRGARLIGEGNLSYRIGSLANDEIGELSRAFDDMAARLRKLTRRLELILDSAGEGIVGLNLEGRIVFMNSAASRLTGWPVDESFGRLQHDLIHHTRRDNTPFPLSECPVHATLNDGEVRRIARDLYWRRDKSSFPVEYICTPIREENGEQSGAVVVFRDISAREATEAQLRVSQRMESIGKLSGGIAHDFNNLLSVIQGNLQLLNRREEIRDDGALSRYVDSSLDAAAKGADLTRRLLAFSRRQNLEVVVLDVNDQLREMEALIGRAIDEDVELEIFLADELPCIESDVSQFENAVLNLVINSRDAMPSGGKLTIETRPVTLSQHYTDTHPEVPPGHYVLVAVTDNGEGMPPEVKERVFEPFFSTKPPEKGTGLGLASVFDYVKQSNGHISLYSELGHGTTFKLYFPASEAEISPIKEPRKMVPAAPIQPATETILVVDDNMDVLEVNAEALGLLGYEVLTAGSADDALRLLESRPDIALLFTDVIMPGGMSGLELATQARSRCPDLRLLITSGYAEQAVRRNGFALEGGDWIQKPIDFDDLEHKVRALLDEDAPSSTVSS